MMELEFDKEQRAHTAADMVPPINVTASHTNSVTSIPPTETTNPGSNNQIIGQSDRPLEINIEEAPEEKKEGMQFENPNDMMEDVIG